MTMNNRGLWLAAAGSFAVAFFAASCGTPDPIMPTTCTTDAACGMGKGCHPVLKTCVATCTGATDCPSDQKTCAKINNSAASFCTCSTDALCAAANTGFICNAATQQCSAKCTSNAGCPSGFTCNTTSGQCGAGGTDGGTDAGMDAGVTDAGVPCNASNDQPDVCGYGNACTQAMTCEPVANGTCSNVTSGQGGTNHSGWSSASTGPVIFNVVDEADVAADCMMDNAFTMTVYAYAGPGMTFPMTSSGLPGFFYYTSTGTAVDIPLNLLRPSNYTRFPGDTVMGAKFTLCSANASSLGIGVGFTNGNGYCTTLTR